MTAPPSCTAVELLALWERAAAAPPARRDDALLGAMAAPLPTSLGARNAALVALRARCFGRSQSLRCDCPRCGTVAEFDVDSDQLARALLPREGASGVHRLDVAGHQVDFRLPGVDDLRAATNQAAFVPALLRRCIVACQRDDGAICLPDDLPPAVADAISQHMEALEPGASVDFDLVCPGCGERWLAAMNVAEVLWAEVQAHAERVLLEVDALARHYGWSEPQILALSPTRRAAYLQLAGAA